MQRSAPVLPTPKHREPAAKKPAKPSQRSKPTKKNVMRMFETGILALQKADADMTEGGAITLLRYAIKDSLPAILAKAARISVEEAKQALADAEAALTD
jgi:hypothetical protein